MKYKIENKPVEPQRGVTNDPDFLEAVTMLKPKQSFFVSCEDKKQEIAARQRTHRYAKKLGFILVVSKCDGGVRVGRTA